MNLRLMGTPGEVATTIATLRACPGLRLVSVSQAYLNRGTDTRVRVYLTALHTPNPDQPACAPVSPSTAVEGA